MRPQIVKASGGKLSVDFDGVATDATVTIKKDTGADLEGSAVVDAELTLDGLLATYDAEEEYSAEEKGIPVTFAEDAVPVPGQAVLVSQPTGLSQYNIVAWHYITNEETRAGVIVLRHPLRFGLLEGATFTGLRAWIDLSAEQCPKIAENFRALFKATVNGRTSYREVIYDVGLRPSDNPASIRDLLEAWPDLRYSETNEWTWLNGLPALDKAWELVYQRIRALGLNPNRIRDVEPLKPLIVNRTMRGLALVGSTPPAWSESIPAYLEVLDKDYEATLKLTVPGLQWYDNDDSGTKGADDKAPEIGRVYLSR